MHDTPPARATTTHQRARAPPGRRRWASKTAAALAAAAAPWRVRSAAAACQGRSAAAWCICGAGVWVARGGAATHAAAATAAAVERPRRGGGVIARDCPKKKLWGHTMPFRSRMGRAGGAGACARAPRRHAPLGEQHHFRRARLALRQAQDVLAPAQGRVHAPLVILPELVLLQHRQEVDAGERFLQARQRAAAARERTAAWRSVRRARDWAGASLADPALPPPASGRHSPRSMRPWRPPGVPVLAAGDAMAGPSVC
jgi:hypothetical protein